MQGERLSSTALTRGGIPFDRGWALRDDSTCTIRGAKYFGGLLKCEARYLEGTSAGLAPHVVITMPDGRELFSEDPGTSRVLSEFLERPVTLCPLRPAADLEHYRINGREEGRRSVEMRKRLGLLADEPLPDFSAFPAPLVAELTEYSSPRGTYFDAYPLNVLTAASMRYLSQLVPDAAIDSRRFRPNLVIADDEGRAEPLEDQWVGRQLSAGGATFALAVRCPRCVMVTRETVDLPADPRLMRALVRGNHHCLSVYCTIHSEGEVAVGDRVVLD
jgi:uncharacterized protein YcbX